MKRSPCGISRRRVLPQDRFRATGHAFRRHGRRARRHAGRPRHELARVLGRCSFLCDGLAVRDQTQPLQAGNTIDVLPPFRRGMSPRCYVEPTHSSVPSAKTWRFHTGNRALMASTSCAQVANAAWRWSAATAATNAASPIFRTPMRWLAAMARVPRDCAATSATTSAMTSAADEWAESSNCTTCARCRGRESSRRTRRSLPPPDGSPAPGVRRAGSVDLSARHALPGSSLIQVRISHDHQLYSSGDSREVSGLTPCGRSRSINTLLPG